MRTWCRVGLIVFFFWARVAGALAPPRREIGKLLRLAGIEGAFEATPLQSGFCNDVFRVEAAGAEPVVVKLFSAMARARCDAPCRGVVDVAVGAAGLGPRVLARTDDALVCAFVAGVEADEAAVRRDGCRLAVDEIAPKLRALHALPTPAPLPAAPAALWRGVDAMLAAYGGARHGPIDAATLAREARRMRAAVDAVAAADVVGHGDLKPSNVMVDAAGAATFIDFELAGPNYRGYDIFKLFRSSSEPPVTNADLSRFLAAYLGPSATARTVDHILLETRLFEPLTWLEAAIFFAFASVQLPAKRDEMRALAADRWCAYEAVAGGPFDANVARLARHAC